MKSRERGTKTSRNPTIRFSELVDVNPSTRVPLGLPPQSEVSFIPMADVSESGHWLNRQTRRLADVRNGFTSFTNNDILFAKITPCAENGKGAHVTDLFNDIGFGSTEFHVLRPRPGVSPRLVFQIAQSPAMRRTATRMMVGSAGQQRVPSTAFAFFTLDRSILDNVANITALLDSLDNAIAITEQLVKQTRRLKDAVAQDLLIHAPRRKLFPVHTARLGQLFKERTEPGRPGLPTMSVTINDGIVDREHMNRRVESALSPEAHLLARKGDIAYNMMRMWQGVCGLIPHDSLVSPAYVVVAPTKQIDAAFAAHLFKLPETIRLFLRHSQGLTKDRLRLYYHHFAEIEVTIPKCRDLQRCIVKRLSALASTADIHKARMDALVRTKIAISNQIFASG